jgi:hypothetical protein
MPACLAEPPDLVLVAGVDKQQPAHGAGVARDEPPGDDAAERVRSQDAGRLDSGGCEQGVQVIGHTVDRPVPAPRVAPADPGPVIKNRPGNPWLQP